MRAVSRDWPQKGYRTYKKLDCPICGNLMEILELFDKKTNEPIIQNICSSCHYQSIGTKEQKLINKEVNQDE